MKNARIRFGEVATAKMVTLIRIGPFIPRVILAITLSFIDGDVRHAINDWWSCFPFGYGVVLFCPVDMSIIQYLRRGNRAIFPG